MTINAAASHRPKPPIKHSETGRFEARFLFGRFLKSAIFVSVVKQTFPLNLLSIVCYGVSFCFMFQCFMQIADYQTHETDAGNAASCGKMSRVLI
jgi:hypothetical protein